MWWIAGLAVMAIPLGAAGAAIGLFLGDSANQDSRGRLKGGHWIFTKNTAQNRQSLVELAHRLVGDRSIKALVFGHSAPLERGLAPLEEFTASQPTPPRPI